MSNRFKLALLGAAGLAVAAAASAQSTYTGDLLLGFSSQSGSDFIYDLGQASSLTYGQQWHLGPALAGYNLNTVSWGVIGDKNLGGTRTAWTTTTGTTPLPLAGAASWGNLDTPTRSIFQNFSAAGAGQALSISATDDNSWNEQTINGTLFTQYHNAYENPNVVGISSANFYSLVADGSAPSLLGTFSLVSDGTVTLTAVPEPSSCVLGGLGLLCLWLRRRLFVS